MGWLRRLFGIGPPQPDRRSELRTGFHWQRPGIPALAAGRGYNQAVHGESFYRDALERLAGGQTLYGVNIHQAAELQASEYKGQAAVSVYVEHERVGSIPAIDAVQLRHELLAIAPDGRASAKAQISAGFEGGDYCVKLSLSRPLKLRTA